MASPIYSICIPTFARPQCVARSLSNLERLVAQMGLKEKLEVCIADNSEDELTKKVVDGFIAGGKLALRYKKQPKNVGFARNALCAIGLAQGEYAHLTSDEAVHNPEVLGRTLSVLGEKRPDCGFLHHHKTILAESPQGFIDAMFSRQGIAMSFGIGMGTFIPKREHAQEFCEEFGGREGFLSHGMVHVPLALYCLKRSKSVGSVDSINYSWVGGKPVQREEKPKADLPSSIARVYLYHHFSMVSECFKAGIITEGDFEAFKRGFASALPSILLRIRVFTPPELYRSEMPGVLENLYFVQKEYASIPDRLRFFAMRLLILNSFFPYHLLYEGWYWYKSNVRKDSEVVNIFDAYRSADNRPMSSVIPEDVYRE